MYEGKLYFFIPLTKFLWVFFMNPGVFTVKTGEMFHIQRRGMYVNLPSAIGYLDLLPINLDPDLSSKSDLYNFV